jgi:hypothetical protein
LAATGLVAAARGVRYSRAPMPQDVIDHRLVTMHGRGAAARRPSDP